MKVSEIVANARVISAGRPGYKPVISIVTPTYCRNAEGLLLRCIDSAAVQTFEEFEHIIIDDGSSDGSEAVVTDAARRDDRIVYIRHERNSGLPGVRTNEGIMRARGDAVAFLFDDNVFTSDFLEKAWAALESSDADVVVTNVEMLTKHGESFMLGGWPQTIELMRNLNSIPNGGVLVRRSFFDRFGLYDPHLMLRRVCDWDLWLRALRQGAKITHLNVVSAIEHGLVSPNSLGNTIAWDVKIAYGYMMDEKRFGQRSEMLRPENIGDVDVLDPEPFFQYMRDSGEWLETVKTFYEPFSSRRAKLGLANGLTNRESLDSPLKWFAGAAAPKRQRVLVVANITNSWISRWLDALRDDPTLIVLNTPEWNLTAFRPQDIDLLVLFDCAYVAIHSYVKAFKDAGGAIVYATGQGAPAPEARGAVSTDVRSFSQNQDVAGTFDGQVYFAQANVLPTDSQRSVASQIAQLASFFIGPEEAYLSLGATCTRLEWPELPSASWQKLTSGDSAPDYTIAYDLPANLAFAAQERVVPPYARDRTVEAGATGERPSWESLGALVQVRENVRIVVSRSVYDDLPVLERFALAVNATQHNAQIVSTDGQILSITHGARDQVHAWIRNFSKVALSLKDTAAPIATAVFLNSEMFSGSEVYGLALAKHFQSLGMPVRVFVPDTHHYGSDSGIDEINSWLKRHGLAPAERAPYAPGSAFLHLDRAEQNAQSDLLATFLRELGVSVVLCSGFMPVFAMDGERNHRLYMALFQPSAYDIADLAFLRERVDGILSDCGWSLKHLTRVYEGPAKVIRTSLPLDNIDSTWTDLPVRSDVSKTGRIRIAIGGTLQPRKRQLEAVIATSILIEAGYDVELNVYGYALAVMEKYVAEIDETIERLGISKQVRRFGLVPLAEIAMNNDVILSASLDESLPQTMLELMRCGLIGAGVLSGGIDEVLHEGQTGYLTSATSSEGIGALLMRAIDDRSNWAKLRSRAHEMLAQEYSHTAAATALADLLLQGSSFPLKRRPTHAVNRTPTLAQA